MTDDCKHTVRRLHAWEIQEARRVFANRLAYDAVRIHECNPWPDRINGIGARMKGLPPPVSHNAITLGNHIYFPVRLLESPVSLDHSEHYKLPWLIHELTHSWQYQQLGWRYLFMALKAQFREGVNAYNFGGENGLLERLAQGACFMDFNLEQQGDICRSYYERICRGQDTGAWNGLIAEVQGGDVDSPVSVA